MTIKKKIMIGLCFIITFEIGALVAMINQLSKQDEIYQENQRSNEVLVSQQDEINKLQNVVKDLQTKNKKLIEEKKKLVSLEDLSRKSRSLSQGVNRGQLRQIITNVLSYLGERNPKWVDLLMLTAQVESDLGTVFRQIRGPAVGMFQMEPFTEKDLWKNYLAYHKELADKIRKLRIPSRIDSHEMEYNVAYASAMTYVHYLSRKTDPTNMDLDEMIRVHKKNYNTYKGKANYHSSVQKVYGSCILD